MSDTTPSVVELINQAADLSSNSQEFAEAVAPYLSQRASRNIPFGFGGLVIGASLGAAGAYFLVRKKLEEKYALQSAEEIEVMRTHYIDKARSLENTVAKPPVDAIIEQRGYGQPSHQERKQPVGIKPPEAVVEAAEQAAADAALQPGSSKPKPTVPVEEATPIERNVFKEREAEEAAARAAMLENEWDMTAERAKRSPLKPYVIHRDEVSESINGGYDELTYTYYEADDVLCNERDEVIANPERQELIGEANLSRFGHGSDDPSIVYIRHDPQELVIELVKSPNSYAEEVHGLKHSDETYRRMRRTRGRPSYYDE